MFFSCSAPAKTRTKCQSPAKTPTKCQSPIKIPSRPVEPASPILPARQKRQIKPKISSDFIYSSPAAVSRSKGLLFIIFRSRAPL